MMMKMNQVSQISNSFLSKKEIIKLDLINLKIRLDKSWIRIMMKIKKFNVMKFLWILESNFNYLNQWVFMESTFIKFESVIFPKKNRIHSGVVKIFFLFS
jgi:hypothetical protein